MISHDLRYSWCSWHCKWHENIGLKLTFVQNYHGPLTRKHWRENELKEFVMNVSRWHKIGFGEVSTIIKPYRDLDMTLRQIPSVKWTFFKPQFHFCVKLGSQVPNSNLSVTVCQMVSGECPVVFYLKDFIWLLLIWGPFNMFHDL